MNKSIELQAVNQCLSEFSPELFMAGKSVSAGCPLHLAVYRHVSSAPGAQAQMCIPVDQVCIFSPWCAHPPASGTIGYSALSWTFCWRCHIFTVFFVVGSFFYKFKVVAAKRSLLLFYDLCGIRKWLNYYMQNSLIFPQGKGVKWVNESKSKAGMLWKTGQVSVRFPWYDTNIKPSCLAGSMVESKGRWASRREGGVYIDILAEDIIRVSGSCR